MLFYIKGKELRNLLTETKGFKGEQFYAVGYFKDTPTQITTNDRVYNCKIPKLPEGEIYDYVLNKIVNSCEKEEE